MILYVNGDSHSAGAEAVNDFCFAQDEYNLTNTPDKWRAHPDNLAVCFGKLLADQLGFSMVNQAQAAGSNDRIIRTTTEYLELNRPDLVLIGWTSWEREEWFYDNRYWQINSAGMDKVWPRAIKIRYKEYVANLDWTKKAVEQHSKIWNFHQKLLAMNIPHLFFNVWGTFNWYNEIPKLDWGDNYIRPYDEWSFWHYLSDRGYSKTKYNHFRADGHAAWAEFLLPYLKKIIT